MALLAEINSGPTPAYANGNDKTPGKGITPSQEDHDEDALQAIYDVDGTIKRF